MTPAPRKYDSSPTEYPSSIVLNADAAELRRLLRIRIAAGVGMWVLALAWSRVAPANVLVLSATALLSLTVTAGAMALAGSSDTRWLGELHVAVDVLLVPAFVTAAGGWRSPFTVALLAKGVSSALLVERRRAGVYTVATIVVSFLCWVAVETRALPDPSLLAILRASEAPAVVAATLVSLAVALPMAASFPLDNYRQRRRELLSENRRLEEAIAELEIQNRQLVALHALSRDLGALGSVPEVATKLTASVRRSFPEREPSFFLVRRDTNVLEPVLLAEGALPERAAALVAKNTLARTPVVARGDGDPLDPRSVFQLLVPLLLGEKQVGLLVLESRVEERFDQDEAALISTMANEMAVALRNADLNARARELRESLEALIENANALILVTDEKGAIQVVNRLLLSLVDPDQDIAVGAPAAELLTPESGALFERTLAALAHDEKPVENLTLALRARKGTERRAIFNLAPVVDRNGHFRSAIAVGQDVTRLDLLEKSVMQSEKLASLGQFVAGIAHEMNNPLTAITVYADYLRTNLRKSEPPMAADSLEKLDEIAFAGERIQGFVRGLLGFARPTSSTPRALDVNAMIAGAVRLCHYDLKKAQVDVATSFGDVPAIAGVEAELQQVFINLFTNAAQAASEAGGRLSISTRPADAGVRVEVADDGPGIPADVVPHIFEPFFSTKEEGKGTGLGLSIVKRIIESHRGTIAVVSEPGHGTTFVIELPTAAAMRTAQPESRDRN